MPDLIMPGIVGTDEEKVFEEVVVRVTRTAKVVSGGKRMSFSALAVVGNRAGKVGWGYGKAGEVPFAVEKAIRNAKRNIIVVPLAKNHTLPHSVESKFKATKVWLGPASVGTGLKCGAAVRAVLEYAGIKDALSKVYGSANSMNTVKAAFDALRRLRAKETVEFFRGVRTTGSSPSHFTGVLKKEAAVIPQAAPEPSKEGRGDRRGGRGARPAGGGRMRDVKGPRERAQVAGPAPQTPPSEPPKPAEPTPPAEEPKKE